MFVRTLRLIWIQLNNTGWTNEIFDLYVGSYEGNGSLNVDLNFPNTSEAGVYGEARSTEKSTVECKRAGRRFLGRENYGRPSKV